MLEKNFDAKSVEPKIRELWEAADAFAAGAGLASSDPDAETFTIMIPPPNVTGSLHMGHALNNTLQDILVRFERMRGKNVLWQPGMDHAGIATQMVVERYLDSTGQPCRQEMGRDAFIERIWAWKDASGGEILNQLKRLGASCDWSRERFTLGTNEDDQMSRAVAEVFVSLFREGLIYRDKRLVNWDPKLLTAISDLEVEQREIDGTLWHFRYPLADGLSYQHPVEFTENGEPSAWESRDYITVATTRPETLLGDTAVAVHPLDPRYEKIVGSHVILPLSGRRIRIVSDEYSDPEKGSGAVKITPGHDFNDFEVGKRHDLKAINVLTEDARITLRENDDFLENLPDTPALSDVIERLDGLDRYEAREVIVEMMDELGLLERAEAHRHMVPHGDRGGVPIEPFLTDQWYVDAKQLAGPAIESVREGRTVFVPRNWEKTYFEWMEFIQPWCISRQLWWGHRIPAWYGPDGHVFVALNEEDALHDAIQYYISHEGPVKAEVEDMLENFRPGDILTRDEDVLDTWFSSALWPFSTLGWPDETKALETYYPGNVLVTGFDIIFFWVARMMMMGLHFMKKEPFDTVYVHALVRDKAGHKMSKSKGNVIDPIELIDEYGADAVRFTLAIMAAQGRDVKLDKARIAGYRNFATKLWNATRFAEMNDAMANRPFDPDAAKLTINRWILTELSLTADEVTRALEEYRFNEAANRLYRFVWNQVCDWYVELLKPVFASHHPAHKAESKACMAYVLRRIYALLHPFMPFVTEELWTCTTRIPAAHKLQGETVGLLCHTEWPVPLFRDDAAADEINWLIDLVTGLRSIRSEMNVAPSARAPLIVIEDNPETRTRLERHASALSRLARVETMQFETTMPKGTAQIVVGEATYGLPLGDLLDLEAEMLRLNKAILKAEAAYDRTWEKLVNEKFIANAKPDVVEAEREKLAELAKEISGLKAAHGRLHAAR